MAENFDVVEGDCLDVLPGLEPDSIDTIVTDPPYGIAFMGRRWDYSLPPREVWAECLRVAKPGAFLIAASSPRTVHRLTCDIEDSGWIIRDMIMWLYGQNIPKGKNVGIATDDEQWQGYHSNLKNLHEPFVVAMKPLCGTFAQNADEYGVAGLNIDGCRIASEEYVINTFDDGAKPFGNADGESYTTRRRAGRYPSNVILSHSEDCVCVGQEVVADSGRPNCDGKIYDKESSITYGGYNPIGSSKSVGKNSLVDIYHCASGCPVAELDEQSGFLHSAGNTKPLQNVSEENGICYGRGIGKKAGDEIQVYDSGGGASRFFYKAKASSRERHAGLDDFYWRRDSSAPIGFVRVTADEYAQLGKRQRFVGNVHTTVKPLDLMRYLVKLTRPPAGGVVLDPFMGSGTTGVACVYERRNFIGIDLMPEYVEIARARIEHAKKQGIQLELI